MTIYAESNYTPSVRATVIRKIGYVVTEAGCWNCVTHADRGNGYPRISRMGKTTSVHRYIFMDKNPKVDISGKVIMHSCDNPFCINPDHLSAGTVTENIKDRDNKGRQARQSGSSHGMAKLTDASVKTIRALRKKGFLLDFMAHSFGVTRGHVSELCSGNKWLSYN